MACKKVFYIRDKNKKGQPISKWFKVFASTEKEALEKYFKQYKKSNDKLVIKKYSFK
jgi:ribosomal protein L33